ncbi:MAG TPA: HAD-IIA family hydrolase [Streptosporangiaceae bacterium]|jgi:HAD superfamily hydrolase (TIGR01450 family)|nr:HAD-IIA family hydrolase [Streptosporangiaceae bacterium]
MSLRGCARPLSEAYDVGLLDLDGTVYIGSRALPGVEEALDKARASGMRLAFVTNNASRTPSAVASLLSDIGVPAAAEDVVTSAQAAARLLADRLPPGARVLVVGGMGLRQALRAQGLRPVSTAAERPAAVAQGYTPDLSYSLIAEGAQAVAGGAFFVGSNGDRTVSGGRGRQPRPGNGSLLRVIATATGIDPIVTGKPEQPLHQEAVLRTGARRPLVIGDRLDTDIEGARRGGADSLLVLTGVTGAPELVTAPASRRPTYVAADLAGLLTPHPEVRHDDHVYECGGWRAAWAADVGHIDLSGHGDPIDGLRALCAAAWHADDPIAMESVAAALERLEGGLGCGREDGTD